MKFPTAQPDPSAIDGGAEIIVVKSPPESQTTKEEREE
jgi:hypothetical protein